MAPCAVQTDLVHISIRWVAGKIVSPEHLRDVYHL